MTMREAVERVQRGETVKFRPRGHSMVPFVRDGQLVTVAPASGDDVAVGTVVLCKVNGRVLLHRVLAQRPDGQKQIGNARGRVNGWTKAIYGKAIAVEE